MIFQNTSYLDAAAEIRRGCSLRISDGKIDQICPHALTPQPGETVYDGRGKLIMPGFANAHCHVPMVLLRGYGEGLPLQRWLEERVFPFEAQLSDEDCYWGTLLGVAELLASGCTTFSDMYMHLPGIIQAVEESGIKANLAHGCSAPGQDLCFAETAAWAGTDALLSHQKAHPTTRILPELALHAEYTSTPTLAASIIAEAKRSGLRLQAHLSETRKEHEEAKQRHQGMTPLAYFASLGMLETPLIFAHAVWLEESDYALLAEAVSHGADITLVHNPSSNLKLASGLANLARWRETGVNIALGTDGASSNNNLNMLEEVSLAALLQKVVQEDAAAMSPAEILQIAGRNGYRAQGRTGGVIETGAAADLFVVDLDRPHLLPAYDLASNLVHSAQASDIVLTMVDGEILYQNGQFTRIDIERVKWECQRIAQAIPERL